VQKLRGAGDTALDVVHELLLDAKVSVMFDYIINVLTECLPLFVYKDMLPKLSHTSLLVATSWENQGLC
jgi:hypothetical protein